ncbi:MAG: TfoX family protein [Chloroflexi bacterium CFX4]|nr:TfoX family protein [Chloroflexi bacterium CFX4]MDL1922793.1 TfoX/Sxy family protein [Chloroflexi bacterium CFX3]
MEADGKAKIAAYAEALRKALAAVRPDAELVVKHMFGGAGYYINGKMIGGYYGLRLALKLSPTDRAALLQVEGAEQQLISKTAVEVPQAFIDDPSLLAVWLAKSLTFAQV